MGCGASKSSADPDVQATKETQGYKDYEKLRKLLEVTPTAQELRDEAIAAQKAGGNEAQGASSQVSLFGKEGKMAEMYGYILKLEEEHGDNLLEFTEYSGLQELLESQAKARLVLATSTIKGLENNEAKQLSLHALLCAKALRGMDAAEFDGLAESYRKLKGLPMGWDVREALENYGYRMLTKKELEDDELLQEFQTLLDDTFVYVYTRDRKGGAVPSRLILENAWEVENEQNYMEYVARKTEINKQLNDEPPGGPEDLLTMKSTASGNLPGLDTSMNEVWLFHGTTEAGAEGITTGDFRLDLAGSGAGTLYGRGIYLAEACTKSDEYAGDSTVQQRFLLLCRAQLGKILYIDKDVDPVLMERACLDGDNHSVLGDRQAMKGTYREFIVFDNDQVYPNYVLQYRQEFAAGANGSNEANPKQEFNPKQEYTPAQS